MGTKSRGGRRGGPPKQRKGTWPKRPYILQPKHYGIDVPSSKWKTESGEAFRFDHRPKTMRYFFLLGLAAFITRAAVAADPAADLASFSVFNNVNVAELAKGEPKVAHGPATSGRIISAESCF